MNNDSPDAVDCIADQWRRERPDLDPLPMVLLGRFFRIYKQVGKAVEGCHQQFGLKQGEFDVLATLRRSGPPYSLTPSELFNALMLTSGAMTNRIDRLEAKGLIMRTPSSTDRRSVAVTLTDDGFDLIDRAVTDHVRVEEAQLAGLSEEERARLDQLLRRWLLEIERPCEP